MAKKKIAPKQTAPVSREGQASSNSDPLAPSVIPSMRVIIQIRHYPEIAEESI